MIEKITKKLLSVLRKYENTDIRAKNRKKWKNPDVDYLWQKYLYLFDLINTYFSKSK